MLDGEQDLLLVLRVLDLVLLNEDVFSNPLHCVESLGVFLLHEEHFSEGSFVDDSQNFKIFERGRQTVSILFLLLGDDELGGTLVHPLILSLQDLRSVELPQILVNLLHFLFL